MHSTERGEEAQCLVSPPFPPLGEAIQFGDKLRKVNYGHPKGFHPCEGFLKGDSVVVHSFCLWFVEEWDARFPQTQPPLNIFPAVERDVLPEGNFAGDLRW